jgi:hypothetical protein
VGCHSERSEESRDPSVAKSSFRMTKGKKYKRRLKGASASFEINPKIYS